MTTAPCIYCGTPGGKRTSEHVLQKAFSTNLTLPTEVCETCNTKVFSRMDGDLVDFVRGCVYWDHPAITQRRVMIQGQGLTLDPSSGLWISVQLDSHAVPTVSPQLIFLPDNHVTVVVDANKDADWKHRLSELQTDLSAPDQVSLKRQILDQSPGDNLPAVQPALIRSARRKYLIRSTSEAAASQIENAVKSGRLFETWKLVSAGSPQKSNESVQKRIEYNFRHFERAMTKTAINFVCATFGVDIVASAPFSDARRFAHGNEGQGSDFVTWLFGASNAASLDDGLSRYSIPGHHTIVLAQPEGIPTAIVSLYERPFAIVHLSRSPSSPFPPDTVIAGIFDYNAVTHEIMHMMADPMAFMRRFFSKL
ncbi:MAG: hypothetical protein KC416_02355 [Myxococcales bacterium]|nr:hypothetical protein [Myxococcales bacterium]